jgi:CARDB protein
VDFFDDDDAELPPPRRGGRSTRGGGPPAGGNVSRQQIRTRQAVLAIGAIVMLILIVIAFKGCLNARKDRAFQNYVSDLSAITVESKQLSDTFFGRLNPSSSDKAPATELSFESEVAGDLGTSQGLLDRASKLDAPGELAGAQNQIELSFELRHDALEGISGALKGLSGDDAKKAQASLYTQMKVLSASDILYARAKDQIEQGLIDQTVTVADGVPDSQFLPDDPDYLDPSVVSSAFAAAVGSGGSGIAGTSGANCDSGDNKVHGTQLVGSTMLPSGVALAEGTTVTATGDDTVSVEVLNSGDATEQNIAVSVSGDLSGNETIPTIASGESQTVEIKLSPAPKAGDTDSINVNVAAVCGEELTDNNKASYSVTF